MFSQIQMRQEWFEVVVSGGTRQQSFVALWTIYNTDPDAGAKVIGIGTTSEFSLGKTAYAAAVSEVMQYLIFLDLGEQPDAPQSSKEDI